MIGNTSDQDSDREPSPPPKTAEKPNPRSGKRDAPKDAPTEPAQSGGRGGRGGRRGGFTGSEDGMFMEGFIVSPFSQANDAGFGLHLYGNQADALQLSVTVMQAASTIVANLPMMVFDKIVTLTG